MAAASTFGTLSSELSTNAAAYESVISQLTGSDWTGPSATAAAASAQQNIDWLQTTSVAAAGGGGEGHRIGGSLRGGILRHDPATSGSTQTGLSWQRSSPPNILGQNTPAIALNEAMYGEFWAQDATAMSTYAANAAASAQVTPLAEPVQSTNPGGTGAQAAAVSGAVNSNASNSGLNGLLSSLQGVSSAAATPAASAAATPLGSLYGAMQAFFGAPFISNSINTINVTGSWFLFIGMSAIPLLTHFVAGAPFGFTMGDATPLGAGLGFGTTLAGSTSGIGGATLAGMGTAAEVGGMSVPAGWGCWCRCRGAPRPRPPWRGRAGPHLSTRRPLAWAAVA